MSYTVSYSGTKQERMVKARGDAEDYLGKAHYDKIVGAMICAIKEGHLRDLAKTYRFHLSFAGLQGAPARALVLDAIRKAKAA
jgi:hypothetical protein